ncbi:hypothetical protein MW887_002195 [Aspergillus wentii]|nr:hypothetical protein MW887_002195 [Aspergillus wentii]
MPAETNSPATETSLDMPTITDLTNFNASEWTTFPLRICIPAICFPISIIGISIPCPLTLVPGINGCTAPSGACCVVIGSAEELAALPQPIMQQQLQQ